MHNGSSCTSSFRECYKEVASWLGNNKVMADIMFVICFCEVWWNVEMNRHQGIGKWQEKLPAAKQRAAFRANEVTIHSVFARQRLLKIKDTATTSHPGFVRYRGHLGQCGTEPSAGEDLFPELSEQEYSKEQVRVFVEKAIEVHGNHYEA